MPNAVCKVYWDHYWSNRWLSSPPGPQEKKIEKTRDIYVPLNRLNPDRDTIFDIDEEVQEGKEGRWYKVFSDCCQLRVTDS